MVLGHSRPRQAQRVFQLSPALSRLDEIFAKFAQPLINRFNERSQLRHKAWFSTSLYKLPAFDFMQAAQGRRV